MLPRIDGQYLFLLPLPLSAPSDDATLYGICYVYTDANFNIIEKKEILTCKGLDYRLPSPSYLFSLGIDPYSIKKGLTEDEFLTQLDKIISNPNVDIFTWSVRNLQIIEKMCLRVFRKADILKQVHALVDINKVLKLHELLSMGTTSNTDSLISCANALGFNTKIELSDKTARLDALIYIVKYLDEFNSSLLNYMLRPFADKCQSFVQSIQGGKFLIDYNVKDRSVEILKPIDISDNYLEALYFDGASICRKYYPLTDFSILAPSAVLTVDRQKLLNVDLKAVQEMLNATDVNSLEPNITTLPYVETYFNQFTSEDLNLYTQYLNTPKASIGKPPLSASNAFRKCVTLFRGNNYAKTLVDNELQNYYKQCSVLISKQLVSYSKEISALANRVNENDEFQIQLIQKIQSYINDI